MINLRKILIPSIGILFLTAVILFSLCDYTLRTNLAYCKKARNTKDSKKQIHYYSKALDFSLFDSDKRKAEILFNRADAFHNNKDFNKALADYNQAIKIDPGNADFYYYRGQLYIDWENNVLALKDLDKAIEIDPKDFHYFRLRGVVYAQQKDFPKALKDANKAIELSEIGLNYGARGFVFFAMGKFDKAIIDYNKSIELKKDDAWLFLIRGISFLMLNEFKKAHQDLKQSFILGKNINSALYYLLTASKISYQIYLEAKEQIKGLKLKTGWDEARIDFLCGKINQEKLISEVKKEKTTFEDKKTLLNLIS